MWVKAGELQSCPTPPPCCAWRPACCSSPTTNGRSPNAATNPRNPLAQLTQPARPRSPHHRTGGDRHRRDPHAIVHDDTEQHAERVTPLAGTSSGVGVTSGSDARIEFDLLFLMPTASGLSRRSPMTASSGVTRPGFTIGTGSSGRRHLSRSTLPGCRVAFAPARQDFTDGNPRRGEAAARLPHLIRRDRGGLCGTPRKNLR